MLFQNNDHRIFSYTEKTAAVRETYCLFAVCAWLVNNVFAVYIALDGLTQDP